MQRQARRRIEREWRKVKCDVVFDLSISKSMFPKFQNGILDFFVKVDDSLAVRYVLSYFKSWYVMVYHVDRGFPCLLHFCRVGMASDRWLDEYFGESNEKFEL